MRKEIRGIGEKALGGEIVGMKEVLPLLGTQGPDILEGKVLFLVLGLTIMEE